MPQAPQALMKIPPTDLPWTHEAVPRLRHPYVMRRRERGQVERGGAAIAPDRLQCRGRTRLRDEEIGPAHGITLEMENFYGLSPIVYAMMNH